MEPPEGIVLVVVCKANVLAAKADIARRVNVMTIVFCISHIYHILRLMI